MKETFAFDCLEDFTFGELKDWPDAEAFRATREAHWQSNPMQRLPDGNVMDYSVWAQSYPEYDFVNYLFTPPEEHPEFQDFEALLPKADEIDICVAPYARDQVGLWYTCAELKRLGVSQEQVRLIELPDRAAEIDDGKVAKDLLVNANPAHSKVVRLEWERRCSFWDAATQRPKPLTQALRASMTADEVNAWAVLEGRMPDPKTGLSNLNDSLLAAASLSHAFGKWVKMARVIGDAMVIAWEARDRVGAGVLQNELEALARREPPLVEIKGEGGMRFCEVRFTEEGQALAERLQAP